MAVPKIERESSISTRGVVDDLIRNCKGIVDYYVDSVKLPEMAGRSCEMRCMRGLLA